MKPVNSQSLFGGFAPPAVRQTSAVFFIVSLVDEQTMNNNLSKWVSIFSGKCLSFQESVYNFRKMSTFAGKCLLLQESDN